MSSLAAEDLAACVARGEAANDVLKRFCHDLVAGKWCVQRVSSKSLPVLQVLPLYGLSAEVLATYASVSEALDAGDWVVSGGGLKKELAGIAKTAMKKLRKRLARIEEDYAGLDDLEVLRHQGNLLLTNLYQVRRGMTEIVVEDFTTEPPVLVTIPLDPRLLPQENADRIFKKARKRQRGEAHYLRRLQETRQEIDWLEAMMLACEETDDAVELDALKKQLAAAGYLKLREEPAQRQVKTATAQPLEATSPSGYALTWGRNPRQNDWISRELASPDDLWFHAHNLPGCHLLLRRAGRVDEIPQEDILYAASLAAGYSRGRHDSRVEVMVTEAKQVRKPKGARPGLVTVKQYRTVVVEPFRLDVSEVTIV